MAVRGLGWGAGLSAVAVSRGYSPAAGHESLIVVASLVWSTGSRACGFSSCSSWALESRLSGRGVQGQWIQLPCSMWNLPRPGIEPTSPALAGRFLTTGPSGKPFKYFISHESQYSWKGVRQLSESCFTKEESEDQRDH